MIDDRHQELAALYALGLLEGTEKSAFEAALAADAHLRVLVRELRETTARLALTAPQVAPTAELKARVLEKIGASSSARSPASIIRPAPSVFRTFLPWAIAACFALACAGLGQLYLSSRAQNALLDNQATLAELELRSARQQLEAERLLAQRQLTDASTQIAERERQLAAADTQLGELRDKLQAQGDLAQFKIATLASLAGNSPEALAVAVWNPVTQEGVLRVDNLPALATDQDYQLWLIDPAYPDPVDGGVFTVDPASGHARINFRPNQPVTNASKFAVSRERKGGVPKAQGPIVLLGD